MPTCLTATDEETYITTNQLARMYGVQPATIRRGLCINGHYFGLSAHKMPNNRLLWAESEAKKLLPKN